MTGAQVLFPRKFTGTRKLPGAGVEHITIVKVHPDWRLLHGHLLLLPVSCWMGSAKQGVFQLREIFFWGVQEKGIHVAQDVLICVVTLAIRLFHHHEVMTQVTV